AGHRHGGATDGGGDRSGGLRRAAEPDDRVMAAVGDAPLPRAPRARRPRPAGRGGAGAMAGCRLMDDAALYERMLDSMEVAYLMGLERAIRRPGVTAALCRAIPHRSVFNSVVYRDPAALEAALPELARAYEDAGVLAWTVWTPAEDARARAAL